MASVTGSDQRLSRVVAVINGKGGVGKTSITSNVGAQLALAGYRVLLVDLDLQGNLAPDLGHSSTDEGNDQGMGLVDAVWKGASDESISLQVISDVRENLDVLPGGRHLEVLSSLAHAAISQDDPSGGVTFVFARKLAELVERAGYDIVLVDGAPGNPILQDMALTAARYILIPTKTDARSWDGLRGVGPRAKRIRRENTKLSYLGVVVFDHSTNATRILGATRAKLEEISDRVPLFETFIRHTEGTSHDARNRGQLAHELARDAADQRGQVFTALRDKRRRRGDNVVELPTQKLSESADSVAGDYRKLAREILVGISAAEDAEQSQSEKSDA